MIPKSIQKSCSGAQVLSPPCSGTIILTLPADGLTRPTLLTLTNTLDPTVLPPESLIPMATSTSASCSTTSTSMATTPISSTILDLANIINSSQAELHEPLDLSTPTTREDLTLATSLGLADTDVLTSVTSATNNDVVMTTCNSGSAMTTTVIDPELAYAALTAVTSGSITPLIKEELRCTIQQKRLSSGKEELQVEFDEPQPSKLTAEEQEKRRRRRERNRIAAQKCRNKRKEKADVLQEESELLESRNRKLREEIAQLEDEKERLRHMLATHDILPTKCNTKLSISDDDEVFTPMSTKKVKVTDMIIDDSDEEEEEDFLLDQVL